MAGPPPRQTNLPPLPIPVPSHGQVSASPARGVPLPQGWQGLPVVWKCRTGSARPDEHVHEGRTPLRCIC